MAVIVVGNAGDGVRSDVQITVESGREFAFTVKSSSSPLYDEAIRGQIESIAAEYGNPACTLTCLDSGALPFTWEARLRTAFCKFTGQSSSRAVTPGLHHQTKALCRTRLYLPGNTPKLFPNACLSRPDAIILDLEESVAGSKKEEALDLVLCGLHSLDWGDCEIMVRVNPGDEGLREIRQLAGTAVCTFVLPKVESAGDLTRVDDLLTELGSDQRLFPLIESPLGMENAFLLAASSPRVRALSLGLEDYLAELGAVRTQDQSESAYARSRVLNAARAAGVTPLASVYPGFEDRDAISRYVSQARAQGYEGVGCIHPAQIAIVHEAFRPTEKEAEVARRIVEAYELVSRSDSGVTSANGQMIDLPTFRRAQRVLSLAEEI